MKKLQVVLLMLLIAYLSNTPELRVADPTSWVNKPQYEENVTNLRFISEPTNVFYTAYTKEDLKQKDFLLHKASHIFFYALFTYLLYCAMKAKPYASICTWLIVTLFALTDEIHQYFVVGRSGRLYDVGLDSFGSILTLCTLYLIQRTKRNHLNEKK